MLIIALAHIFISAICLFAGLLIHRLLRAPVPAHPVTVMLSGLAVLTGITQLACLFIPIGLPFQVMLFTALFLLLILQRNNISDQWQAIRTWFLKKSLPEWCTFFLAWMLILWYAAGPTQMDDTDSYHIQMVRWIKEYGTVPGLANLHERFGFNSSWFSSVALFSPPGAGQNHFSFLNGTLSLWLLIYLVAAVFRRSGAGLPGNGAAAVVLGISLLCFPLLRGNAATVNYDMIISLLIFVLVMESSALNTGSATSLSSAWLLWLPFLLSVRIMNAPLCLLLLLAFLVYRRHDRRRSVLTAATLLLFFVVPFLARNVLLSGYLLFPATYPDIFAVDWKADPAIAEKLVRFIHYYNRAHGFPIAVTEQLSGMEWVREWFRQLYGFDKWIIYPAITGLILSVPLVLRGVVRGIHFWIYGALLVQLGTWVTIAPDPRFVYGILLVFIVVAAQVVPGLLPRPAGNKIRLIWQTGLCAGMAVLLVSRFAVPDGFNRLLNTWSLPVPATQQRYVGELPVSIPEKMNHNWNPRCYALPLPCSYRVDTRLKQRGNSISDGFYIDYSMHDDHLSDDLRYLEN